MKIKNFKYFYPEKPVLTTIDQELFGDMSNDDDYVAEPKYNGQRCCLHIMDGKVEFWGRHGKKLKYNDDPDPEMVAELKARFPKGYFLFDSELRHNKTTGIRNKLVLWDVFIWRDELLNKLQYWSRRAMLELRIEDMDTSKITLIAQHSTDFKRVYEKYASDPSDEFEGLVMKNVHGMINIGRTSAAESNWMFKVRKPSGRYKF
jgi:ATP-dependent DNA ligase